MTVTRTCARGERQPLPPKLFRGLDDMSISAEGAGLTQPEESIARQALDFFQAPQFRVIFLHLSRPGLGRTITALRPCEKMLPIFACLNWRCGVTLAHFGTKVISPRTRSLRPQ